MAAAAAAPEGEKKLFNLICYTNPVTKKQEYTHWDVRRYRIERKPKTEKLSLMDLYQHQPTGQYVPFEFLTPHMSSPFGLNYYKPKEVKSVAPEKRKYNLRLNFPPESSRTPAQEAFYAAVMEMNAAKRQYIRDHNRTLLPNLAEHIELVEATPFSPAVVISRDQFIESKFIDIIKTRTVKDPKTGQVRIYDPAFDAKVWFDIPGNTPANGRKVPEGSWLVDGVLFSPSLCYDGATRKRCSPEIVMKPHVIVRAKLKPTDTYIVAKGEKDLMIGSHINVTEIMYYGVEQRRDADESSMPMDEDDAAYLAAQAQAAAAAAAAPPMSLQSANPYTVPPAAGGGDPMMDDWAPTIA
jgi:hypothetical protein